MIFEDEVACVGLRGIGAGNNDEDDVINHDENNDDNNQ